MSRPVACIGGLKLFRRLEHLDVVQHVLGPQETPYGWSQPIVRCTSDAGEFLLLARFGTPSAPVPIQQVNYRANVAALEKLGVCRIIGFAEAKAISHNFRVGQFVIVDDVIDETAMPSVSFHETVDSEAVRQWPVFCPDIRKELHDAVCAADAPCAQRGVLVCVAGHRQETPSEARKYATFGGDLIARAVAPETFLAKEISVPYAALTYITAYAESGSSVRPYERGRMLGESDEQVRIDRALGSLPRILANFITALNAERDAQSGPNASTRATRGDATAS